MGIADYEYAHKFFLCFLYNYNLYHEGANIAVLSQNVSETQGVYLLAYRRLLLPRVFIRSF